MGQTFRPCYDRFGDKGLVSGLFLCLTNGPVCAILIKDTTPLALTDKIRKFASTKEKRYGKGYGFGRQYGDGTGSL